MDAKLLMDDLRAFASEREWERYHTPKNLSMAVACEAAELMELFQWLTPEESEAIAGAEDKMEAVRDEMADILIYLLRLADILQVEARSCGRWTRTP